MGLLRGDTSSLDNAAYYPPYNGESNGKETEKQNGNRGNRDLRNLISREHRDLRNLNLSYYIGETLLITTSGEGECAVQP